MGIMRILLIFDESDRNLPIIDKSAPIRANDEEKKARSIMVSVIWIFFIAKKQRTIFTFEV